MLSVALGAFGLDDDINNSFFVRKVLEDGTTDNGALANRLADKRYRDFSGAFGFGELVPRTALPGFANKIVSDYETRQFEIDIGNQNPTLRAALEADRELPLIAAEDVSEDTKWLRVLGVPSLRNVIEVALGLPQEFAAIDLDEQLSRIKEKASAAFGADTFDNLTTDETLNDLIRTYIVRADLKASQAAFGSSSTALSLVTQAAGFQASLSLF